MMTRVSGPLSRPLGFVAVSDLSTAVALSSVVPTGTATVIIGVEGGSVRVRDDGTAPTGSVGVLLTAGTYSWEDDKLVIAGMKIINATASTATLSINCYGADK